HLVRAMLVFFPPESEMHSISFRHPSAPRLRGAANAVARHVAVAPPYSAQTAEPPERGSPARELDGVSARRETPPRSPCSRARMRHAVRRPPGAEGAGDRAAQAGSTARAPRVW